MGVATLAGRVGRRESAILQNCVLTQLWSECIQLNSNAPPWLSTARPATDHDQGIRVGRGLLDDPTAPRGTPPYLDGRTKVLETYRRESV